MSRVWMEFDPETDEDSLYMAMNGLRFYCALKDIDNDCRSELKHGDMTEESLTNLIGRIRSIIGSVEPGDN